MGLCTPRLHVGKLSTLGTLGLTLALSGPATGQQKIYWTEVGIGVVRRANLDASNIEDLVTGLSDPIAIALDLRAGKMYWADSGAGKIQRSDLDGSNIEDLVTGLSSPYGIALDLDAGQMYWTNVGQPGEPDGTIQRANLDGSNVANIITSGLVSPHGIALDTPSFKMYWADSEASKIQRASINGFFIDDLVGEEPSFFFPLQVALDLGARKMYWTAFIFEDGVIERANLDGSNVELLISTGTGLGGPRTEGLALDVGAGKMYWTQAPGIWRADLDGSNREELITGLGFSVWGIALDLREPIPTISEWGLLAMTLLVLTAGTLVLIRRREAHA